MTDPEEWLHGEGEMAVRIRAHPWEATPLGPIGNWPQSLRTAVSIVLGSGHAMQLAWGPQRTILYNDAYAPMLGDRHPSALGLPFRDAWPDIWTEIEPLVARVDAGETVRFEDMPLVMTRHGYPEETWWNFSYSPVRDESGSVAGLLNVTVDASAGVHARHAEAALRDSHMRQRLLIESFAQAMWETDAVGVVVADSPSWRAYTSQTLEEWLGYGWLDAVLPDDRAYAERQWREKVAAGEPVNAEFRLRAPQGNWRWTNVRAAPVVDAGGRIEKWVGLNIDIDDRKRAEAALRESEERFRSVSESGVVAIAFFDTNGAITDANDAFLRLVGYTRSEMETGDVRWDRLTPPEWMPATREAVRQYEQTGRIEPYEKEYFRKNGERFWAVFGGRRIESSGTGVAFVLDITERKRAEAVLRESEARYQALFTASPVPFMVLDANPPDFTILAANEAYFAATLTTPETLIGRRLFDVFTDDPRRPGQLGSEALDISLERVLRTKRTDAMERVRYDIVTPAGGFEEHWWLATNAPLLDADGNITAILHQVDRQTELEHAEQAVRESSEREAFLLRLSDMLRPLGDANDIQRAAAQLLGEHWGVDAHYAPVEREDGIEYFVVRHSYTTPGRPSFEGRYPVADFPGATRGLLSGAIMASSDVITDPELTASDKAAYAAVQLAAFLMVPLIKEGRLNAVFAVHSVWPRAWTRDEALLLQEVAERTWAATERARAETALRDSEQRFREFGENSSDVLWIVDTETMRLEYLSPAFERIWGEPRDAVMNDLSRWAELVHPDDRALAATAMPRLLGGQAVVVDYRIVRPDGEVRWIRDTGFPINDGDAVKRGGGISQDVTDLKRTDVALRESEERLQMLMQGIPQLVWRAVNEGHWTWASPQWTEFTGQTDEASHGRGWLKTVHPDDRDRVLKVWAGAVERGEFHADFRLCHAIEHRYRWFQSRATPVRDEGGAVEEWLGTSTDVDDLRQLQQRQGVLVAELQHRTRNLITVVNAVSQQTISEVSSLPDFRERFGDRLAALSRVQGLLSHLSAGERVTFRSLLDSELKALGAPADKLTLDGPEDVPLRSSTVQTFSLALHELATNALKYGALATPDGHLAVRWHLVPAAGAAPRLHVDWRETGVDMTQVADRPQGGGYGRELIEHALPYQLDADTTYEMAEQGVHCTINVPIAGARA